jgi:hypothetical protein
MPSEKWFGLDAASKVIWDRLDDKAKSIILGYTKPESQPNRPVGNSPPFQCPPVNQSGKPPFKAQVSLHEMSAYDFILAKSSTCQVNSTHIAYFVSKHEAILAHSMSLIDRGANGGVSGDDVRVIFRTNRTVNVKGIDNHHVSNIGIKTVGGVVQTQHGPVIAIMHQYALLGKGASIHSSSQLEWYKNDVNDKSLHVPGGLQRITTLEGYIIPLTIKDGLSRLDIRPRTDHEFDTLPHVFLTSELEWDPTVLDHQYHDSSEWGDEAASAPGTSTLHNSRYDEFGQYRQRVLVNHLLYFSRQDGTTLDDNIDQCILTAHQSTLDPSVECDAHILNKTDPDFGQLRPLFGWLSPDIIKKTFTHTTQYAPL